MTIHKFLKNNSKSNLKFKQKLKQMHIELLINQVDLLLLTTPPKPKTKKVLIM